MYTCRRMNEGWNQGTDCKRKVCEEEWETSGETDSQRQVSEEWEKDKIKVQMARNR